MTEWTESRNWTESTETYGAKRSAQAESLVQQPDWRGHAAYLTDGEKSSGLAGRFLADSQLMLIVICFRKELSK